VKIVQLLPELNEGGVEVETLELSRELVNLGHESIIMSAGGKLVSQLEKDGGKHIELDVCSKNLLTAPFRLMKLRKMLKELSPDILHARSRVPAWLGYLANKKLQLPFITTVHGFNSVSAYSKIMTKGDAVICVSGAVKEYIEKHYHTEEEKITVISGGIDLVKFNPENLDDKFIKAFKSEYAVDDHFVVSVVGRITQLKDIETFLHAVPILKKEIPNIKGLIVGGVHQDKQGYFESLKKLVVELKIDNEIVFAGSQNQISEIYALSDVVVSASKKPESFGRSVAEAIAMNTPVVASNHGGVKDIIITGENGYLFEMGNANELSDKIMLVKSLKFDGFDYILKNFSLQKSVKKTLHVYESLIK
jgi:glycosyltransferase involved in cell wall biosynthesis